MAESMPHDNSVKLFLQCSHHGWLFLGILCGRLLFKNLFSGTVHDLRWVLVVLMPSKGPIPITTVTKLVGVLGRNYYNPGLEKILKVSVYG